MDYTRLTNLEVTGDLKAGTIHGVSAVAEVKATAGGAAIPAGATFVTTVASTDAAHIIVLPDPVPGTILFIAGNAKGYELRSSAPASIAINGGAAANAESAVGADVDVMCVCMSATRWIAWTIADIGTFAALEAAAAT